MRNWGTLLFRPDFTTSPQSLRAYRGHPVEEDLVSPPERAGLLQWPASYRQQRMTNIVMQYRWPGAPYLDTTAALHLSSKTLNRGSTPKFKYPFHPQQPGSGTLAGDDQLELPAA